MNVYISHQLCVVHLLRYEFHSTGWMVGHCFSLVRLKVHGTVDDGSRIWFRYVWNQSTSTDTIATIVMNCVYALHNFPLYGHNENAAIVMAIISSMNSSNELITQFNVNWNEDGTIFFFYFFEFELFFLVVFFAYCLCQRAPRAVSNDLHKMTEVVTFVIQKKQKCECIVTRRRHHRHSSSQSTTISHYTFTICF